MLKSRRVNVLVADGVSGDSLNSILETLASEGVHAQILAPHMGYVETDNGEQVKVDDTLQGMPSALADAVIVPDGEKSLETLMLDGNAKYQLRLAYKHLKAIGLDGGAQDMLQAAGIDEDRIDEGIATGASEEMLDDFIEAMKQHRCWDREPKTKDFAA